jgi:hypothetical protein
MTKKQEIQKIFRLYRDETGETDLDMKLVVRWAVKRLRYRLPTPVDPIDLAAKDFSTAAREEMREDEETHQPYRANHAYSIVVNGKTAKRWIDIDGLAPHFKMVKAANERKEQMVGDGLQLTLDLDHWHRIHPDEPRIEIDYDLTDEIEWRKNAPPDKKKKAS